MTKTKITLAGLALAVTLLVAVQVRADMVTFTFAAKAPYGNMPYHIDNIEGAAYKAADVAETLDLTATEGNGGVDFVFTSKWTGGNPDVNGGRGNIYNLVNSASDMSTVYIGNTGDVFGTGSGLAASNASLPFRSGNIVQSSTTDEWGLEFFLPYGISGDWNSFIDALYNNDAYFEVHMGNLLDENRTNYAHATFNTNGFEVTSTTPEPCTLAVLGLGLAGVGLAARRRRK